MPRRIRADQRKRRNKDERVLLSTSGLTKQFGHHKAVNNVDLHVEKRCEFTDLSEETAPERQTFFKNDQRIIKADRR